MSRRLVPLLLILSLAFPGFARRRAMHSVRRDVIERVVVVVLENTNADVAEQLPFLSRLASEGARLDQYYAIAHPSQPNYIAVAAGSTWGVDHDNVVTLDVAHLGDLLEKAHLDWRVYAEHYPGHCYLESATEDLLYVRRHVPFLEFANVQKNAARCNAHIVNATVFEADVATRSLPAFSLFIPNQRHNGHDTSPGHADAWLESRFGPLLNDERFTSRTLFVVTFDESDSTDLRVATVLWGAGVRTGSTSRHRYDHYSLLRTIEELLHLGTLGQQDARAEPIRDVLVPAAQPHALQDALPDALPEN
jgi:hypothetical protein